MATPSYSARFSSETSRASPASSFVSTKLVAWNPSERSFSWTAAAISGCLPNPRMRQPVGREEEAVDIPKLTMLKPSLGLILSPIPLATLSYFEEHRHLILHYPKHGIRTLPEHR